MCGTICTRKFTLHAAHILARIAARQYQQVNVRTIVSIIVVRCSVIDVCAVDTSWQSVVTVCFLVHQVLLYLWKCLCVYTSLLVTVKWPFLHFIFIIFMFFFFFFVNTQLSKQGNQIRSERRSVNSDFVLLNHNWWIFRNYIL